MLGLGLRKPRFGFELLTEIKISLHLYQPSDFPIKTFHSATTYSNILSIALLMTYHTGLGNSNTFADHPPTPTALRNL